MLRRHRVGSSARSGTPAELLVVGLGNPGSQYAGTRHNVGVEVVEFLAERHGGKLRKSKEHALVDEVRIGGHRVALAFPLTFMNESGRAVQALVRRYGIDDLDRVLIVHDEVDLPVGKLKVKVGGGLAGHNGLKSVRDHLHTTDFARLRLGVGKPPNAAAGAKYVLSKPAKAERVEYDIMVRTAAEAVEAIVDRGLTATMNEFN